MHPIHLLSRLAPKTTHHNAASAGRGTNTDVVDWRFAAHALQGLPQAETDWAFYRFAGQDALISRAKANLLLRLTAYAKGKGYRIRPQTIGGLVNVAIHDHVQPHCVRCNGRGVRIIEQSEQICASCQGRGRPHLSMRGRCELIGIDHKSYGARHEDLLAEAQKIIGQWEVVIFVNVRKRMGECA